MDDMDDMDEMDVGGGAGRGAEGVPRGALVSNRERGACFPAPPARRGHIPILTNCPGRATNAAFAASSRKRWISALFSRTAVLRVRENVWAWRWAFSRTAVGVQQIQGAPRQRRGRAWG